jgi:diguanylate cyclase (GGDEF)-like protein
MAKAMEIISQRTDVLHDICNHNYEECNSFTKTYKVSVSGSDVYINLYGAISKSGYKCGIAIDVTEHKLEELKVHELAYADSLTGLPNREYIKEFLGIELSKAQRGLATGAVMFMDLDKFKQVNDNLGHVYGDILLKEIGKKLKSSLREYDLVGRLAGDEFVIVITNIKSSKEAVVVAKKILSIFTRTWKLADAEVEVNTSIGIAMYPEHGITAVELLRNSDTAMYTAKKVDGNQYAIYGTDTGNKD